tara:strand:+ start:1080 stop:2720 length:1641 start_codon:yes stop_codon:yes gene_type:complete
MTETISVLKLGKTKIIISLAVITTISLLLKLYLIDFSIPIHNDNLEYALFAIAHNNGDFSQSSHRGMGWSIFVSLFYNLIDSENFLDYSNAIRGISIAVSLASISIMYLLGRKFFDPRYSIILASLFAFEPHLNYNSGLGLAESFFIFILITSFYFVLNKNTRTVIISLALAGIAYWIRLNGFFAFIVITVIYFVTLGKTKNSIRNYFIGLSIFLLIISPVLLDRNEQFGDPFYSIYSGTIFSGDYNLLLSEIGKNENYSAFGYIEENGLLAFIDTFIINGIYNELQLLSVISFPYLFILIPFGILFSFRAFDQNKNFIRANWIHILLSLAFVTIILAIVPERRFLFHILPFLMIFSVIPIQRVTEYGLSTFSFSRKQKDLFLIMILIIIIILSGLFTLRYDRPDTTFENEKLEFSNYALNNLDGIILRDFGGGLDYVTYLKITSFENFKDYKINQNMEKNYNFSDISLPNFETIELFIENSEKHNLKYIISNKEKSGMNDLIDELYFNHKNYPYLKKIFDSNMEGYSKLQLKIFEIDYELFHGTK